MMEIRIGKHSKDEGGSWVRQSIEGINCISFGGNYRHDSFLIHLHEFNCSIYVYDDSREFIKLRTLVQNAKNNNKNAVSKLKTHIVQLMLDHITPKQFTTMIGATISNAKNEGKRELQQKFRQLIDY